MYLYTPVWIHSGGSSIVATIKREKRLASAGHDSSKLANWNRLWCILFPLQNCIPYQPIDVSTRDFLPRGHNHSIQNVSKLFFFFFTYLKNVETFEIPRFPFDTIFPPPNSSDLSSSSPRKIVALVWLGEDRRRGYYPEARYTCRDTRRSIGFNYKNIYSHNGILERAIDPSRAPEPLDTTSPRISKFASGWVDKACDTAGERKGS